MTLALDSANNLGQFTTSVKILFQMKGRGSQIKVNNKFSKHQYTTEHIEGLDVSFLKESKTKYIPS